jgi:hypothetical protein
MAPRERNVVLADRNAASALYANYKLVEYAHNKNMDKVDGPIFEVLQN